MEPKTRRSQAKRNRRHLVALFAASTMLTNMMILPGAAFAHDPGNGNNNSRGWNNSWVHRIDDRGQGNSWDHDDHGNNGNHGNGHGQDTGPDSKTVTPIKHVVILFSENISFDHYFATYPKAANPQGQPKFTAADGSPAVNNLLSAGLLDNNPNLAQPYRLDRSEAYTCSQDHNYTDEQKAQNGGLMDKFVQATAHLGVGCKTDGSTVMGYYDGNTVTALWNYAQHFAMSDNSFGTTFGPSTPGALNLISGQTGNAHMALTFNSKKGKVKDFEVVTVTGDPDPALDDCGADQGGTVTGKETVEMANKNLNVGDLLNAKGISWGWFQGGFAPTTPATFDEKGNMVSPAVCNASHPGHPGVPNPTALNGNPNGVDIHGAVRDYNPHHAAFQYYNSTRNPHHLRPASVDEIGHDGPANHQYDLSDFYDALAARKLPAVSYLKAANYQDGHPGNSDPLSEQAFFVKVINAIEQSPEWKDTAVFIMYDDTDGWYDHAASPIVNQTAMATGTDNGEFNANDSFIPALPISASDVPASPSAISTSGVCGTASKKNGESIPRCGYGPRMPFLVISPWAKKNYVDHTITDQTSSLAFIEYNWDLGTIDGPKPPAQFKASFDRLSGSILGMFDFEGKSNTDLLILDEDTGTVVKGHGSHWD